MGKSEHIKNHIKNTGKCPNPGANVIKRGPKPKENKREEKSKRKNQVK